MEGDFLIALDRPVHSAWSDNVRGFVVRKATDNDSVVEGNFNKRICIVDCWREADNMIGRRTDNFRRHSVKKRNLLAESNAFSGNRDQFSSMVRL